MRQAWPPKKKKNTTTYIKPLFTLFPPTLPPSYHQLASCLHSSFGATMQGSLRLLSPFRCLEPIAVGPLLLVASPGAAGNAGVGA